MSDNESKSDDGRYTPPEIVEAATKIAENNLMPEKSRKKYEKCYNDFMEWRTSKGTTSFSENVLLAYFGELAGKFKSTSIWTFYSMLKNTLQIKHQVDITNYNRLNAFLRRNSEGYKAKKAKTFLPEEMQRFLDNAPDKIYLFTKTALVFGIKGGCRRQELYNIKYSDVKVYDPTILVTIRNTKMNTSRTFTITNTHYDIVQKYIALRPIDCTETGFFLKYSNGRCFNHKVGINKFGALGKTIAEFLNLPNPELYTGHCFRRTSATVLVTDEGDISTRKLERYREATAITEVYVKEALLNKADESNMTVDSIKEEYANPEEDITIKTEEHCESTTDAEGLMDESKKSINSNMILDSVKAENEALGGNMTLVKQEVHSDLSTNSDGYTDELQNKIEVNSTILNSIKQEPMDVSLPSTSDQLNPNVNLQALGQASMSRCVININNYYITK